MNKEQFYRKDISTYKSKYFLFCVEKSLKTEKLVKRFGELGNKSYLRRIKIEEL